METHRLQSVLSCLPVWFRHYASLHLDSIPKLVNHLLLFMGVCNCMLFLSCWHIPIVSDIGFNTPLCVLFLGVQNVCLYVIFNNARFEGMQFLAPTEFMVGNSLGITIGAALLALTISNLNRNIAQCTTVRSAVHEYLCETITNNRGPLSAVSFWSGLVFWLEFCLSLLITIGRQELTNSNQYENLSLDDRFPEYAAGSQQQQTPYNNNNGVGGNSIIGSFANAIPTPSFVGNYSSVPEIHASAAGGGSASNGAATAAEQSASSSSNSPLNPG